MRYTVIFIIALFSLSLSFAQEKPPAEISTPLSHEIPQTIPGVDQTVITSPQQNPLPAPEPVDLTGMSSQIDTLLAAAVTDKVITGAVVLAGHGDEIIFEKAYGKKNPSSDSPMTVDTIFDLASLTKVIATAPSVMWLVEHGYTKLDTGLSRCLPPAGQGQHRAITLRQLLTHYSGLPSVDRPVIYRRKGKKVYKTVIKGTLIQRIYNQPLEAPSGRCFIYSDIGYVILGKTVENISGKRLDRFTEEKILKPLGMNDSYFCPGKDLVPRIAASEEERSGRYLCGSVQDPMTANLNGVSGCAGLFSTARDLSRFARMILHGGTLDGKTILKPETVALMTSRQSPPDSEDVRGLGWDIDSRYSFVKGRFFSPESFGHTGFTGTLIWIDPAINTYIVVLTNRCDLTDHTKVTRIRRELSEIVASQYSHPAKEKAL